MIPRLPMREVTACALSAGHPVFVEASQVSWRDGGPDLLQSAFAYAAGDQRVGG